jgi:hypothetical protein
VEIKEEEKEESKINIGRERMKGGKGRMENRGTVLFDMHTVVPYSLYE